MAAYASIIGPTSGRVQYGPGAGLYHTGNYIQEGGNVFKWLGHMARSIFPIFSPVLGGITQQAKHAAINSALTAGKKILAGENVKQSLIQSGKETGKAVKDKLAKNLDSLQKAHNKKRAAVPKKNVPPAKKKKGRQKPAIGKQIKRRSLL